MAQGTCPVCQGTTRCAVPENTELVEELHLRHLAGYDAQTDTLPCRNCGGQTMLGQATGLVNLRRDTGEPCVHEYIYTPLGRCYHGYTCRHCGYNYTIDSGD